VNERFISVVFSPVVLYNTRDEVNESMYNYGTVIQTNQIVSCTTFFYHLNF